MSDTPRAKPWDAEQHASGFWRGYSTDDDKARINSHYDQSAEFFTTLTGGEWNVYSCNLWEQAETDTQSQERKLDLMAEMMQLRQGQRVLDVGCGWGGPLVYLSRRYGVSGIGITPAPRQVEYAKRRAARYGVPVEFRVSHWREFEDPQPFDAVYSDEVIVHFNDLHGYFEKARTLLKPGGVMLNKELHFTGQRHMALSRAMVFIKQDGRRDGQLPHAARRAGHARPCRVRSRPHRADGADELPAHTGRLAGEYARRGERIDRLGRSR